jgi:hypothetical protein
MLRKTLVVVWRELERMELVADVNRFHVHVVCGKK